MVRLLKNTLAQLLLFAGPTAWAARVQVHQFEKLEGQVSALPLCAPEIVDETCKLLSGNTKDVSMQELQQMLAADDTSITTAWEAMGLTLGERVSCIELCAAVVNVLGEHFTVPPMSDVACYEDENGEIKCDIDLSPEALGLLVPPGTNLPNLHDEVPPPKDQKMKGKLGGPAVLMRPKTVDYVTHDILVREANLFRIYPTPVAAFVQETTEESLLEEEELKRLNVSYGKCDTSWCNSMANPCEFVYSCGGCPKCASNQAPDVYNQPLISSSGCANFCSSISSPCELRMSCGSCPQCQGGAGPSPGTTTSKPSASAAEWKAEVAKRNVQAQAYVNKAIMKLKSREADSTSVKWFGPAASSDMHFRAEMVRVLNAVANMMGNVEYVFPGPKCSPNTYAYVYPRGSLAKDRSGKFVFYLCQLYMDSEVSVQIETLTHEGSHHATAYTDDVCMDEVYGGTKPTYVEVSKASFGMAVAMDDMLDYRTQSGRTVPAVVRMMKDNVVVLQLEPERKCQSKAYGRRPCQDLAKADAVKALRNADNICYWIQDLTDAS